MIVNHQDLLEHYVNSEIVGIDEYCEKYGHGLILMRNHLLSKITDYVERYNTYNREILTVPQNLIDICEN